MVTITILKSELDQLEASLKEKDEEIKGLSLKVEILQGLDIFNKMLANNLLAQQAMVLRQLTLVTPVKTVHGLAAVRSKQIAEYDADIKAATDRANEGNAAWLTFLKTHEHAAHILTDMTRQKGMGVKLNVGY
jgi:hypothetical protein